MTGVAQHPTPEHILAAFSDRGGSHMDAAVLSFALLGLLACGDGSGPDSATPVARIVIEPADPDRTGAVVVQDSVQLSLALFDSADQVLPSRPAVWSSSDPALGTVSDAGLVHGLEPGRITITAVVGADTGAYVTDVLPLAATLELLPAHLGLVPGGVYDLSVLFRDANGAQLPPDGRRVVWDNGSPEFVVLAGGIDAHVTGVTRGGTTLSATGSGATAQIGADVDTPVFFSVVAGDRQTCGHTSFFVVYCWGSNIGHMLGAPIGATSVAPLLVEGFGFMTMKAVVPGNGHACALTDDGAAWCWGDGTVGQLGDGSSGAANVGIIPPRQTAGGLQFESLAAGDGFTCGLTTGGAAYCWGRGDEGVLGNGTSDGIVTTPTPVSGGLTFSELGTNPIGRTVCGVADSGGVWCWGRNANGQLGDGTIDARAVPGIVPSGILLYGVAVGARHACALDANGAAYCWGDNGQGQLGQTGDHLEPGPVDGDLQFTRLAAGAAYTCGISSGDMYCWGDNDHGELGNGTTTSSASPVLVSGGLSFIRLSAGNDHTCARTDIQDAYCWGSGEAVGSPVDGISSVPVRVQGQP